MASIPRDPASQDARERLRVTVHAQPLRTWPAIRTEVVGEVADAGFSPLPERSGPAVPTRPGRG